MLNSAHDIEDRKLSILIVVRRGAWNMHVLKVIYLLAQRRNARYATLYIDNLFLYRHQVLVVDFVPSSHIYREAT